MNGQDGRQQDRLLLAPLFAGHFGLLSFSEPSPVFCRPFSR
jgi:hypothetical protein